MEERVSRLGDVVPGSILEGRSSRRSSISSLLTEVSDLEEEVQQRTPVQSGLESEDSEDEEEPTISDNDDDDPMNAGNLAANENASGDSALAAQLADVGLRRSARMKLVPKVDAVAKPLPTAVAMRKRVVKTDNFVLLVSIWNNAILQKLTGEFFRMTWTPPCPSCLTWHRLRYVVGFLYISLTLTAQNSSTKQCTPTSLAGDQPLVLAQNHIDMSLCK